VAQHGPLVGLVTCPVCVSISYESSTASSVENPPLGATSEVSHYMFEAINVCVAKITCEWCKQPYGIADVRMCSHSGIGE